MAIGSDGVRPEDSSFLQQVLARRFARFEIARLCCLELVLYSSISYRQFAARCVVVKNDAISVGNERPTIIEGGTAVGAASNLPTGRLLSASLC